MNADIINSIGGQLTALLIALPTFISAIYALVHKYKHKKENNLIKVLQKKVEILEKDNTELKEYVCTRKDCPRRVKSHK